MRWTLHPTHTGQCHKQAKCHTDCQQDERYILHTHTLIVNEINITSYTHTHTLSVTYTLIVTHRLIVDEVNITYYSHTHTKKLSTRKN